MRHQLNFWGNPWRPAQDWFDLSPVLNVVSDEETSHTHIPACEVEEKKDHFLITLDVPGVSKEGIRINVLDGKLVVSAERKHTRTEEKEKRLLTERRYGKFERIFELGDNVDAEKIEAHYEDGVLQIVLGKMEQAKPRQIPVNSGEKRGLFAATSGSKEKALN